MGRHIPEDVIEEINSRVDIVQVIGREVTLNKKGKNYQGLCPFHHEKTPSFTVNHEKQFYYCFGCGAAGNAINFIMKIHSKTFPEAISQLAEITGVSLPEQEETPEQKAKRRQKDRLYELNELANKFYHYLLIETDRGRDAQTYLLKRGINRQIIEKFQLGYAPKGWNELVKVATNRGFSESELIEAGLVVKKDNSYSCYDRFRNRIIFPICDLTGRIIGFGGRVLDDSLPKYLNTPETPIFNKRFNLYGINLAGQSLRTQDTAIIVEGYMDVIAAYQYGIENIIASLGTAFTKEQAKLITRFTKKVAIAYDSDSAGQAATLRGLDILQDMGCEVRVVSLPQGSDPDDYLREHGKEAFLKLTDKDSFSLIEYKLSKAINKYGLDTISGKTKIVASLIQDLNKIKSAVEKEQYISLIASELSLTETAIKQELASSTNIRKNYNYKDKNVKTRYTNNGSNLVKREKPLSADQLAEQQLFWLIIEDRDAQAVVEQELGENFFTSQLFTKLYSQVLKMQIEKKEVNLSKLMDYCSNEEERKLLAKTFSRDIESIINKKQLVKDCINKIKQSAKQSKLKHLQDQLHEAEAANDQAKTIALLAEIQQLVKQ